MYIVLVPVRDHVGKSKSDGQAMTNEQYANRFVEWNIGGVALLSGRQDQGMLQFSFFLLCFLIYMYCRPRRWASTTNGFGSLARRRESERGGGQNSKNVPNTKTRWRGRRFIHGPLLCCNCNHSPFNSAPQASQ